MYICEKSQLPNNTELLRYTANTCCKSTSYTKHPDIFHVKQKQLWCKKRRGQSEAAVI